MPKPLNLQKTPQNNATKHTNTTKHFNYTTTADVFWTVSWGNDSYPTGVLNPVYGIPTFPLTTEAV